MSDKLNIEDLVRSRLEGAELSPSPQLWRAIQQKLRWPQFVRFNPGRFNIYYAGALLLVATGLVVLLTGDREKAEPVVPNEKTDTIGTRDNASGENAFPSRSESKSATDAASGEMQDHHSANASQLEEKNKKGAENTVSDTGEESPGSLNDNGLAAVTPVTPVTESQLEPTPVTYFTSSIQSGCEPLTVHFTNQSVNATSFFWDFGTGDNSKEENPVYEFKKPGSYIVTLTAENHSGYPTVSRMMIEVLESPVADFQIDKNLEGVDNHVVLNLVNYSSDGSVFAWNLVNDASINCSNWSSIEYQPTLELKAISPESKSIRLEVINEHGCSDTAVRSLPIVVQSSEIRIKFATAFSPNPSGPGDGSFFPGSKRIDLFHPHYIEVPAEFHMRVFTRRGELIFETRELYKGWDGYLHQEPAPADVYVWMAEGRWADGQSFIYKGDVTLVRNQSW